MEDWEIKGTYIKIGWYSYLIVDTSTTDTHNTFCIYSITPDNSVNTGDVIIIDNSYEKVMKVDFWSKYYFPEIVKNQMYYDYNTMGAYSEIIQYIIKNLLTIELY